MLDIFFPAAEFVWQWITGWFLLQYLLDDIALIVSGDFRPAASVAPPVISVVLAMEIRLVVSSAATAPSVVEK